jgi:hypothetical protein
MLQHLRLNLDFAPLIARNHRMHAGTCIGHLKEELPDVWQKYGELPQSYVLDNTTIHQLWWSADDLDFADIGQQLGMEVITISTICQPPGNVVPLHRDTFFQINKQYSNRKDIKVRANIHMEDYKLGHFIQYIHDDQTVTNVDWKAGDAIMWTTDVVHLGANAGMQDKYTMQVSGFLI